MSRVIINCYNYDHWKICSRYSVEMTGEWCQNQPTTVPENDGVTILWDMPIHTDREAKANRPDIIIKDKKDQRCILMDVSNTL